MERERERESERDESNYWMNRNCWQNIFSYFLHDFSAWCYRQNIFTTLKRGWHNVYVDFLCIFRFLQYKIWCCQARNLIYYSFRKMKPLHRTIINAKIKYILILIALFETTMDNLYRYYWLMKKWSRSFQYFHRSLFNYFCPLVNAYQRTSKVVA